jgi:hypothetical protein
VIISFTAELIQVRSAKREDCAMGDVRVFFRMCAAAAVCVLPPALFGAERYVGPGQSLQQALNEAVPGDTITIEAGATFTGSFVLPNKTGTDWITIQSSRISALPAGQRVTPAQAAYMPKLVSPNGTPALSTATGAHNYRVRGLELTSAPGVYTFNTIALGTGSETAESQLPTAIELDRLYVHGDPVAGGKRGISLNARQAVISNSYFTHYKSTWQDTQAIMGWNGAGPYQIVNNYLEASGENIMFGGATAKIAGLVPSDIVIRNNHIFKPLSWKKDDPSYAGTEWLVKNLIELKIGRRVTIDGNILENIWVHGQPGIALQLTVRTESGAMPWAVVEDITFTNNIMRNAAAAINITSNDGSYGGVGRRMTFRNNIFENIRGIFLQIQGSCNDVVVDHNTIFQTGTLVLFNYAPSSGFVFRNNIAPVGSYGIFGNNTAEGIRGLAAYAPGSIVTANVIAGAIPSIYPAGNYFPASINDVRFVDAARSNYTLADDSPYRRLGTDGQDLGAVKGAAPSTTTPVSIWNSSAAPTEPWRADSPVTLGVKFRADTAGTITGIRFWKASGSDSGTHVGLLYTNTGTVLAQATFTAESTGGWQQVKFAAPVAINPGVTYIAAYHSTSGWSADGTYFLSKGADAPPLHALRSGVDGANGLYSYGSSARFPVTSRGANYWVDVLFLPGSGTPVTPPSGGTSIWNTAAAPTEPWRSDSPLTLGVKFRSDTAGKITGVRFWKASGSDSGTHVGLLYTNTGTVLAQATFTAESTGGWQHVKFAAPVAISPGVTYIAAYYSTSGWSADGTYFLSKGADAPPLHALRSGVDGANGLYSYGSPARFPVSSRGANYWVDVVFE